MNRRTRKNEIAYLWSALQPDTTHALAVHCAAVGLRDFVLRRTGRNASTDWDVPVNPYAIAREVGIEINIEPDLEHCGRLFRVRDRWIMELPESLPPNRRVWACAHELAHYALQVGGQEITETLSGQFPPGWSPLRLEERVCDGFAAELLFPSKQAQRLVRSAPELSIDHFMEQARRLGISLQAASIQVSRAVADYAFVLARHFPVGTHPPAMRIAWSATPPGVFVPKYKSVEAILEAISPNSVCEPTFLNISLGSLRGEFRIIARPLSQRSTSVLMLLYLARTPFVQLEFPGIAERPVQPGEQMQSIFDQDQAYHKGTKSIPGSRSALKSSNRENGGRPRHEQPETASAALRLL
jgi:hypothetical protein